MLFLFSSASANKRPITLIFRKIYNTYIITLLKKLRCRSFVSFIYFFKVRCYMQRVQFCSSLHRHVLVTSSCVWKTERSINEWNVHKHYLNSLFSFVCLRLFYLLRVNVLYRFLFNLNILYNDYNVLSNLKISIYMHKHSQPWLSRWTLIKIFYSKLYK